MCPLYSTHPGFYESAFAPTRMVHEVPHTVATERKRKLSIAALVLPLSMASMTASMNNVSYLKNQIAKLEKELQKHPRRTDLKLELMSLRKFLQKAMKRK